MGYLLKEVLKTLCGVNQWSYAVFWKIGCHNTKLLIWEESYNEPLTLSGVHGISGVENPELSYQDWGVYNSQLMNQAAEKLHLLVNKMMMESQFNLVGEGLVGRAAVTGNHQWFLSEGFSRVAHPPEVLKELTRQFSAGIQTIAVIPVLPHGVVQFGSLLHIMENMGFVEDVRMLISQLGCVPGVLLSDENATKNPAASTVTPVCLGSSVSVDSCGRAIVLNSAPVIASCSYLSYSSQAEGISGKTSSSLAAQVPERMQSIDATFQASNMTQSFVGSHDHQFHKKIVPEVKAHFSPNSQIVNNVIKAEVISPNSNLWMSQQGSLHMPRPPIHQQSSIDSLTIDSGSLRLFEQHITSTPGIHEFVKSNRAQPNGLTASNPRPNDVHFLISSCPLFPSTEEAALCKRVDGHHKIIPDPNSLADASRPSNKINSCTKSTGDGLQISSKFDASSSSYAGNNLITDPSSDGQSTQFMWDDSNVIVENDLFQALGIMLTQNEQPGSSKSMQEVDGDTLDHKQYGDACIQLHSEDDLFDVLGTDFKNKLLNGSWNNYQNSGPDSNTKDRSKNRDSTSVISQYASSMVDQGKSDSGIFSTAGFDRLLDSIASKPSAKHSLDDDVSCRTTLTNLSSSTAPNASSSYGQAGVSRQIQVEVIGQPKTLTKSGGIVSRSFRSECSKENSGAYSQSSSIYGSQISSWVEQGHDTKPTSSVSTGYSKKPDESSKTSRKRLKPGENPRPRPKDRQMIQDRVKELREIVPNGSKCSIDALLERTIKHMLFLQSVAKHADKLKQTGESKIISKEGGLLLKDNFEGGATWAYEVGSQSMVCPIIVEDLNQPRQMLVEMLCEERGLFLEIADIIRGLGLTILKGVMETRNDKIWARFAVEANRDVTRMEIFISLVRLLEQTGKGGAESAAKPMDSDQMMMNTFHQATSIPATGRPCNLQ